MFCSIEATLMTMILVCVHTLLAITLYSANLLWSLRRKVAEDNLFLRAPRTTQHIGRKILPKRVHCILDYYLPIALGDGNERANRLLHLKIVKHFHTLTFNVIER